MSRKIVLLTGGVTNPGAAKTAINLIRYCPEEVVAVLDPANAGKTAKEVLGIGSGVPVVGSFAEAERADVAVIGIAPPGGRLPEELRKAVLEAIWRRLDVISGLHSFLSDDPEFAAAARKHGVKLHDLRKNDEREVTQRVGIDEKCLRIHTVGQDCNVGKMVVSLEVARALTCRGLNAKFVATGQTGMLIEGDGCAIDSVVADFVNGAAERLVLANQHHPIIVVEGQGSIAHPRYSSVTLGLLHGCMPDGLILCYEMGRETVHGMEKVKLPGLQMFKEWYETMANVMHPCKVIGVGINGRKYSSYEVEEEKKRVENELGLPACDVLRHGPEVLVEAVIALKKEIGK